MTHGAPEPVYPGIEWDGRIWNCESLRAFYQPWRDVEAAGASVHFGECGCYNKMPNDVTLRWFADLFGLFKEFDWGFALWNFAGDFGIVEHGRPLRAVRGAARLQRRSGAARSDARQSGIILSTEW
jgi:endoglucanase